MPTEITLQVTPKENAVPHLLKEAAARMLLTDPGNISHLQLLRRSIDARGKHIKYNLKVNVWVHEPPPAFDPFHIDYKNVDQAEPVVVIGAGPAGLFAALRLIESGFQPIVVERGKAVRARRRDLAAINKEHIVDPESNYCFGEGGAGTYSDGKLYTRSKKRGSVEKVLKTLVFHGADSSILIDAHPHIGTNKLPRIIVEMRETIRKCGGKVLFETRMDDLILKNGKATGIVTRNGTKIEGKAVILATGHSARDVFEWFDRRNWAIEAKAFALGVRIEHPQEIIDKAMYHCDLRGPYLPPASYRLVHQAGSRGVYSFCMCPGGIIAPCATGPEQVVTNGWSPSKRNNPFANSGIVVTVEPSVLKNLQGPLAGLHFQQQTERTAWISGGKTQAAPAQRLTDFLTQKTSSDLPGSSYPPGITAQNLHEVLPKFIAGRLQEGLKEFGKKIKGYHTHEAVLHGVESRTSSPVRIPRNKTSLEHIEIENLYPCGEGAGYAGGIVSAAIDGERCADKVVEKLAYPRLNS